MVELSDEPRARWAVRSLSSLVIRVHDPMFRLKNPEGVELKRESGVSGSVEGMVDGFVIGAEVTGEAQGGSRVDIREVREPVGHVLRVRGSGDGVGLKIVLRGAVARFTRDPIFRSNLVALWSDRPSIH